MIPPLGVTIIGGYLGAGKTTLVNQMLRQADGLKLAVLVNEFGALPIDEDLIEAQDDELISIAGGCICCSFGSDLTAAMLKLAALSPRPDHIVIEASGVALPGSIEHSIAILPGFAVDGICVLADCAQGRILARDEYVGDTIARQFADAHLLLLTKPDLVDPDALADFQSWLSSHWPGPQQVVAHHGQVPNEILLGRFPADPDHDPGPHHDAAYDSVFLPLQRPVDAEALVASLTGPGMGILRAKGFVRDHAGARVLVQIVGRHGEVTGSEGEGPLGVMCIGLAGTLATEALLAMADDGTGDPPG